MSGENVAGRALKATRSSRSPKNGSPNDREQDLERVHEFDHGAELGPLERILPGQAFVAREHARDLAVVTVEEVDHPPRKIPVCRGRIEAPGQSAKPWGPSPC